MSFKSGDRLLHYEIDRKIGEGGMGAIYQATDTRLDRQVALKVLPADMASDPARLERFRREAKAVAALNHPHIVTLFNIENDGPTHFLTMELVEGTSLDRMLAPGGLPLAQVFDIGIALADALAAAHAKGVIHRDLKPANVMLTADGRVKVLDFGLAKLAVEELKPHDPELTSAATALAPGSGPLTQVGTVMGTAPYMSPEQLEGKVVDHRTDIFALGVVLYEICSGRRPFGGETSAALISAIMRDAPQPVTDMRQDVPRHLARIFDHCLEKNVTDRFQSALDIRNELRTLRREFDSGVSLTSGIAAPVSAPGTAATSGLSSAPGASGVSSAVSMPASAPGSGALGVPPGKRTGLWLAIIAAAVIGLAGGAFGLYSLMRGPAPAVATAPSFQDMKMSVLMSRNDLLTATLSGDGRYLAYVTRNDRTTSLMVRQVRTGSDVPILMDNEVPIQGITFSPDGDYLYYLNRDPDLPNYNALFKVASLGGSPRKVFFDVDTAATFSPDGKEICFKRGLIDAGADSLVVGNVETGEERELIRIQNPERFEASPAWSPDGTKIAMAQVNTAGGVKGWAIAVDVETGESTPIGDKTWLSANSLGWTHDGSAVLVSSFDFRAGITPQIYRLPYPAGPAARMTHDLNGYGNISLSADGISISAVRRSNVNNLWVAPVESGQEAAPITFASGSAGSINQLVPLPGGTVAFSAPRDNKLFLWRMEADGSDRRQLTSQGVFIINVAWAEGTGLVFNQVDEGETILAHIWRVNPDGSGLEQLTQGDGEQLQGVSPAGNAILFIKWDDPQAIWVLRLDGSQPYELFRGTGGGGMFSPDGQRILVTKLEGEEGKIFPKRYILPLEGGEPLASFLLPPGATNIQWTPDGTALTYVDRALGWNIMRKSLPDGEPEPLTHFTAGPVLAHQWHPDGSRLVLRQRLNQQSKLWMLKTGETEPTLITEFKTGNATSLRWAPDEPLLYFSYITSSQDVVLITDFQ